jgi:glycosyltransferase involved in cell wall biosynthesis
VNFKIKIGFFSDSYRPYVSGVVRSIDTFKNELEKIGHEVYIFAPSYKNVEKEPRVYRFPAVPSPTNKEFTLAIPFSLHIFKKIQELRLDIIHTHSPFILGALAAILCRIFKIPLVFTYHTLYEHYVHYIPIGRNLARWLVIKYTNFYCNRCDLVVVPTETVAENLHQRKIRTPLTVIPTGINLDEFKKEVSPDWLKKNYNIDRTNLKILISVGRMGPEKNIIFLLRTFQKIQLDFPQTILLLVGGGPYLEEYQQLTEKMGIEKKVIFTGNLGREAIVNCYKSADIFVFASLTESQGIVLAEAKAAGLPIVAIKAGGVGNMVKDKEDGYLVEENLEIFAEKTVCLLKNEPLYHQMSKNALKNVIELSSQKSAQKLSEAYQTIIQL